MNILKILINVIILMAVAACTATGVNSISQSPPTNTVSINHFPILDMDAAMRDSNNIRIYTHTIDRVDGYSAVPSVTSYDNPDYIFFSIGYYADPILVHNPDVYYWGQFGVPIKNENSTTFAVRKKTKAVHLLYNPTTNSGFVDPGRLLPVITSQITIKDEKNQPTGIIVYASLHPSMIFQIKKEKGFFAGVESITYSVLIANTPLTLLDIVKDQYRDAIIADVDHMQLEQMLRQIDVGNKYYKTVLNRHEKAKNKYLMLATESTQTNNEECNTNTPEWLLRCSGDGLLKLAAGFMVGFGKGLVSTAEITSGQRISPKSIAAQETGGNALYSILGTDKNKVGAAENTGKAVGALYYLTSIVKSRRTQESIAPQSNTNNKSTSDRDSEVNQPETKTNRVISITLLDKLANGALDYKYSLYQVKCKNNKSTRIFFDKKADCIKDDNFHLLSCSAFFRRTRTVEDAAKEFCAENL